MHPRDHALCNNLQGSYAGVVRFWMLLARWGDAL